MILEVFLWSQSLINSNIGFHKIQDLFKSSRSSDVFRTASNAETILGSDFDPEVVETALTDNMTLDIMLVKYGS